MSFELVPLGNLLRDKGYIRGPFGSALKRGEMKESGTPVYEQQHAIDGTRTFRFFVDGDKLEELKRFIVKTNDLIISCSGTVGRISVIRPSDPLGIISQALLILRPNLDALSPTFLYYVLVSPQGQAELLKASHGAVQQNIAPRGVVEQIPIPLPNLKTQGDISAILANFDDRITLLRETNATLEAIAQALFKSWFVDFDPVRAKLEGRTPEGMDEVTAALFPDGFEESELGLVPRGWCTSSCQDLFDVRDGTHESPKPALVGYPLVTSKHITSGRVNLQGTYLISESDYTAISKRSKVNRLDVLITMIGTVGLSTILLDERNNFAIKNIGLFKTSEAPQFAYFFSILLKSPKMQLYLAARLAGTTQKYLSLTALREMRLLMPTEPILVEFSKIVSPLFDGVQRNHEQAQTLATLRDTLLPRLISGQLRLPDVELQIQKAAI